MHIGLFRTERVLDHVLELCWAPRELCLRWLVARHIDVPPWLSSPRLPGGAFKAETSSSQAAHSRELNGPHLKSTRTHDASAHSIETTDAVEGAHSPPEGASLIKPEIAEESIAPPLRPESTRASEERIHRALGKHYPAATGKKPPNIKEVVPLVKADLLSTNETGTWDVIQRCARDARYLGVRRPRGRTVKSEQSLQ